MTLLAFIDLETRVPSDYPLRAIKRLADQALKSLSPDLDRMHANVGRPSVPPERLLKSSLLIVLYSVRSERAFYEQLEYNLLFRWFLGMNSLSPASMPPPSPRTGSGCSGMAWARLCSAKWCWKQAGRAFCRTSIARWMEP